MKCPFYEAAMDNGKDKSRVAAAESKVLQLKPSPVKEPTPIKPQFPSARSTTVLFSIKDNTRAVHNKENTASRDHEGTLDEGFEDSGYLSLHNSQIDDHRVDEENEQVLEKPTALLFNTAVTRQEKTVLFPSKCQGRTESSQPVSLSVSSLVEKRTVALASTPSTQHSSTNLPVLKFQQAVCEELAKSYKKNKRYDWSIVSKVAENHLLDRVIGGHMGLEYVDMLASLLSRNMRSILIKTLSLLGDMDLISCKKVSRTWRRIICEDTAALRRCQQAEEALRESRNSLRQRAGGLTRDVAVSRVVFSCMQTLASSSSSPSSSAQNGGINRLTVPSHKGSAPNTRFNEYMQAARNLKQHQSLRSCKRCGSPATHLPEVQRATCSSCLFDFCTRCQEPFHASTPCRTVQPRSNFSSSTTTSVTPGSTRSRRSLRRL